MSEITVASSYPSPVPTPPIMVGLRRSRKLKRSRGSAGPGFRLADCQCCRNYCQTKPSYSKSAEIGYGGVAFQQLQSGTGYTVEPLIAVSASHSHNPDMHQRDTHCRYCQVDAIEGKLSLLCSL